jgi:hypothetical protein
MGSNARELNEEEGMGNREMSEEDVRKLWPELPTIEYKAKALRSNNDLLPEFKPYLVPA